MLRSWAQDSRELQHVLGGRRITAEPVDEPDRPATLLGTLQDDILHNRAPTVAGPDRSVQIHMCHGARRQVEVLRDAVLHALATDETLQPRDVVIMTPDLATFAPLIEAAFPSTGISTDHQGIPDLRVRIADRSPAATNPLVRFAATVLDLADGRVEATTLRELVARPVVQQRFGFDVDTAGTIDEVVADTRVAWGIDADDRDRWGAGRDQGRTWRRGLDRALTGVFYADDAVRVVGDTVPLDGVEGQDARPVGILAAVLDRIGAIRHRLAAPMPISLWAPAIDQSVRMLAAPGWDEEWQWDQLERLLAEAFPSARGADPAIDVGDARRLLARWVDDRPSPLHFRTGDVTVCTLAPMRSVPYRIVCLLGMDDRRFPRGSRDDGDDLLATDELVGDHDRGAEDRQLLLDAVMAAGDTLIVTYAGRDELTNDEYPPAVPVSELQDVLGDMLEGADSVVTDHPLQSFSEVNFTSDSLGVPGPWGFDPMQLAGAEAVRLRPAAFAAAPITWPPVDEVDPILLGDLVSFLQHPTKRFLTARAGISVAGPGGPPDDNLPADLGGLDKWGVEDRLLSGLLAGHPIDQLARHERLTDALPAGRLGDDDLAAAQLAATDLVAAAQARDYEPEVARPLTGVVSAGGRAVEGSVLADHDRGRLFTVIPSVVQAKHRLSAYAGVVFATAVAPETPWTSILIGKRDRDGGANNTLVVRTGPILEGASVDDRQAKALDLLGTLVELYTEGHRRPLPLPCETGYAWFRQLARDAAKAEGVARKAFGNPFGDIDASHRLAAPDLATFDALKAAGFEEYCRRLWMPVFAVCGEAGR